MFVRKFTLAVIRAVAQLWIVRPHSRTYFLYHQLMISIETEKKEAETPKRAISAESVLSYVIIGCFVVAVIGILATLSDKDSGIPLLASAGALGVVAYIYCHKR